MSDESNGVVDSSVVDESQAIENAIEGSEGLEATDEVVDSEEGSEEGVEATEQETEAAAAKLKAKEVKGSDGEKFKIKVDGQEIELTKDEMIRHAQMGKAGQRAMQEKAELQKRTADFIRALQEDPESVLADEAILGGREKVIALAQKILSKQLEEEALTPAEKKSKELEAELERFRKEKKDSEEQRKKQDYENTVKQYEEDLQVKVQDALVAENLPRNPAVLQKMAAILLTAHDNKLNITPRQAAKLAKEELQSDIGTLLPSLTDDQIEAMLGTELITRIRKASMKKVRAAVPSVKVNVTGKSVKDEEDAKKNVKKTDMSDFMRSAYFGTKK